MRENGSKWILLGFFVQEAKKARGQDYGPG
jgi:hypothetical protein